MTTEELKQEIAKQTGIPAALLTGETVEENIAQAKALLAYKREHNAQDPKTAQEQFNEWIGGKLEELDRQAADYGLSFAADPAGAALAEIEKQARKEEGGYPAIQNGGNADTTNTRPAKELFAEWLERTF